MSDTSMSIWFVVVLVAALVTGILAHTETGFMPVQLSAFSRCR